jgi:hypothetical protein
MQTKSVLTKILAVVGTSLVWFPILAPLLFSLLLLVRAGVFRLDYLMPAELFLAVLAGGGLLAWSAVRARSRRGWIFWGLGTAAVLLVGSQAFAVVSGLASGEAEAAGWRWGLVISALAGYTLAVAAVGIGGILLLRDLFKTPPI